MIITKSEPFTLSEIEQLKGKFSEELLLVGSLSNDLFRVASLVGRGSEKAASRFLLEGKRWANELQHKQVADYIRSIASDVVSREHSDVSLESAEQYLMYGVLLQNYALHQQSKK